jgi:Zn-dependent metalloprotease
MLLRHESERVRAAAMNTLLQTSRLRGQREILGQTFVAAAEGGLHRSIFDAQHGSTGNGVPARQEGAAPSADRSVNEAYDGFGATYKLYHEVFGRDSIDGKGLRIIGVVHFGVDYNNAFWNGSRMMFGDGDGQAFVGFTKALDVIGHELTHGVTEFTCNLEYHRQSGALNESMSDVFGSLVKQYALGQSAKDADWLIGAGILGPALQGVALRSMKAPGTAFADDDQPTTMAGYVESPDTDHGDWGGVHRNSGIPNHAFYLAAVGIGGNAWEGAGHVWYDTLLNLNSKSNFADCATVSYQVAGHRFGSKSKVQQEVGNAWAAVGIDAAAASAVASVRHAGRDDLSVKLEQVAVEARRIVELATQ